MPSASLYTKKRLTPNQKAWNKEIERLIRFGKKHKIQMELPEKPTRVTKKSLAKIHAIRGRKALKIGYIKVERPTVFTTRTPEGKIVKTRVKAGSEVNAETVFNEVAPDTPNIKSAEMEFLAKVQEITTPIEKQPTFSESYIDSFKENLGMYTTDAPILISALNKMLDIIQGEIGEDGLSDFLRQHEQDNGALDQYMYYGLGKAYNWFRSLAVSLGKAGFTDLAGELETEINRYEETDIINYEISDYATAKHGKTPKWFTEWSAKK